MIKKINFKQTIPYFLLMLSACGPQSDLVTIRIDIPPTVNENFSNLSNSLFMMGSLALSQTCNQSNVLVGYNTNQGVKDFKAIPTQLKSFQMSAVSTSTDLFLAESMLTTANPIVIQVPRAVPVEIGMQGVVYSTDNVNTKGDCLPKASYEPNPSSKIFDNVYSLIGHQVFNLNQDSSVKLGIRVANSFETQPLSLQAKNDFIQMVIVGKGTPASATCSAAGSCDICIKYAANNAASANQAIEQCFGDIISNSSPASYTVTFPRNFPIETHVKVFSTTGTLISDTPGKICRNSTGELPTSVSFTDSGSTFYLEGGNCALYPNN